MSTIEDRLLTDMTDTARGARRNGLFALWLFVRQCEGSLPPAPLSDSAQAKRLDRLERRLSSLSLPAPLRRALPGSLKELRTPHPERLVLALRQLVAPAREAVGTAASHTIMLAARTSRRTLRSSREGRSS